MCTGEHSPSPLEPVCVFLEVALLLLSHETVINCVSQSLVTLSNLPAGQSTKAGQGQLILEPQPEPRAWGKVGTHYLLVE